MSRLSECKFETMILDLVEEYFGQVWIGDYDGYFVREKFNEATLKTMLMQLRQQGHTVKQVRKWHIPDNEDAEYGISWKRDRTTVGNWGYGSQVGVQFAGKCPDPRFNPLLPSVYFKQAYRPWTDRYGFKKGTIMYVLDSRWDQYSPEYDKSYKKREK